MYEYEAKHGLGRSDSDSALERLSALPNPDPKTFEAIAGERVDAMPLLCQLHVKTLSSCST